MRWNYQISTKSSLKFTFWKFLEHSDLFNRIDQFNLVSVSQTLPPKSTACWPPIEIRITGPWRWIRSWKANKGDFIINKIELKSLQGRTSKTIPKSSPNKKKVKKKNEKKTRKFHSCAKTFECKWRTVGCQVWQFLDGYPT